MRYMILLGVVLMLAGCVGPHYSFVPPAHAEYSEQQRDRLDCSVQAAQAAQGAGQEYLSPAMRSYFFQQARDRYFAMCLESRGWNVRVQ
jgi:hypothetical protein